MFETHLGKTLQRKLLSCVAKRSLQITRDVRHDDEERPPHDNLQPPQHSVVSCVWIQPVIARTKVISYMHSTMRVVFNS